MTADPLGATRGSPARIDPLRDPAALSNAITRRWRPYRIRGYALAIVLGFLVGGVIAPVTTTVIALVVVLTTSLPAR